MNHVISDGIGLAQFMSTVAEMARGCASTPSIPTVWERHLLDANDTPRVTCKHNEYDEVEEDDHEAFHSDNMIERSFFFGGDKMTSLYKLLPLHLRRCTKFELLTASLWRCRTFALNLNPNEEVRLMCIVNVRSKFNPPLPSGYYGNAFVFPAAKTTAGQLCGNPLEYAVELVKEAKASVTEEYVKSVASLMVINGKRLKFPMRGSYLVSDVRHMGFRDLDFGWGKAEFGGLAKAIGPISFIISAKDKKGEVGALVPVCLPVPAMERFAKELEKMLIHPTYESQSNFCRFPAGGRSYTVDWRSNLYSIFVTSLSHRVTRNALWDAFSDYGHLADVFIHRGGERKGRTTFAFVRYWREKDAFSALQKADSRYLEGVRIKVYKAKLTNRGHLAEKSLKSQEAFNEKMTYNPIGAKVDGRSFKEVVCNHNSGNSARKNSDGDQVGMLLNSDKSNQVPVKSQTDKRMFIGSSSGQTFEEKNIDVDIPVEEVAWLERSVIGRLNPNTSFDHVIKTVSGLNLKVKVKPISNVRVLLQFEDVGEMENFIAKPGNLMEIRCSSFHYWDDSGDERVSEAWLKLEGVPLFLWHQNFLKELASRWGKVIKVADITADRKSFVAAWLLVEISDPALIPPIFNGYWKSNKFSIKVSIDDSFSECVAETDLDDEDDNLSDKCSISGELGTGKDKGSVSSKIDEDFNDPVVEVGIDFSVELAADHLMRDEPEFPANDRILPSLGVEYMSGRGFIPESPIVVSYIPHRNSNVENSGVLATDVDTGFNLSFGPEDNTTRAICCTGLEEGEFKGLDHFENNCLVVENRTKGEKLLWHILDEGEEEWSWNTQLRRVLFDWEIEQWDSMMNVLNNVTLSVDFKDKLVWSFSPSRKYSAKEFCKKMATVN
ncbi:hypothetical protein COLO4_00259 [Corchorus olitorius]|uniref:RRM domain-containing protein n=1 Tax=Corchorus olitorius TaxID=93759 RepID=A0A1R3L4D6_9ROSI|nr:hypothetical protein COLO4_00259 [Corchorus olitorius]